MSATNKLMFQVGIEEVSKKIADIRSSFESFEKKYANGIKIRLEIQNAEQVIKTLETIGDSKTLQGLMEQLRKLKEELNQVGKAASESGIKGNVTKNEASRVTSALAEEEKKLAYAVQQGVTASYKQISALRELKSLATQYLGVWGAQTFLNKIIETGGLLEQQRMSIGAILGNTSQANQLFGQIQKLAVKSPFGVVQLDTMSKQLTAYNFKYHELYDWTKRLADISAATGTEVSRLSLALGHVRSEGALSGYTLRQFAMGNVPLLQTLAKQLGKTTSEIRKMTRGKEISYEEVATALKSLTEDGGMFANAQEVMSGALNAKFKNLRDAFDIMYGEMAESVVGDALKKVAETLTTMAKHWEEVGAVVLTVAGYFGIQRAAMMSANAAMVQGNLAAGRFTKAQIEAQAATGNLTSKQLLRAVASRKVAVADAEAAAATLGLSKAQLAHVRNVGKVTAAYNFASLAASKYTVTQLRLMASLRGMSWARLIFSANAYKVAWAGIANAFGVAKVAVKGFLASAWPLLAISVAVEGITRYMNKISEAKDRVNELRQAANEGFKNLQPKTEDFKVGGSAGMGAGELKAMIEDMETVLKDYSPQAGNILSEAFKIDKETGTHVHTLTERYEMLAKAIKDTKDSYLEMGKVSHVFEDANDDTDGWFDESFRENTEDYIEALGDRRKALEDFISQNRTSVVAALEKTRSAFSEYDAQIQAANAAFKASGGKEGFGEEDLRGQIELMRGNIDVSRRFYTNLQKIDSDAVPAWGRYTSALGEVSSAQRTLDSDLQTFTSSARKRLEVAFGATVNNWTEAQKLAVQKSLEIFMTGIDGYSNMADKERKELEEKLLKEFNIKLDVDARDANKVITNMISELNGLVGREWVVKMKLDQSTSAYDAIERTEKSLSDAEKVIKKLGNLKGVQKDKDGYYVIPAIVPTAKPGKVNSWENPWAPRKSPNSEVAEEAPNKYQLANEYNQALGKSRAGKSILDHYGITTDDKVKNKSGGRGGSQTDEVLAMWRKRVQLLEKYRQQLEETEKLIGREQAKAKLMADGNFAPLWGYFSDPNDYAKSLNEVVTWLGDKTKDRKSFVEELGAKKGDDALRKFKDDVRDAVSELGRLLSVMGENYDTYKKWMDLTGDANLAATIAGVTANSSYADYLKEEFGKRGGERTGLSAESFFGLSESDAQKFGENSELYKLWGEWQKNNQKIKKQNLELYSEAIKNSKGYAENVADINRKLEEQIAAIVSMTGGDSPTSQQLAQRNALIKNVTDDANKKIADETWKNFKETEDWGRMFADLDKISTKALRRMLEAMRSIAPEVAGSVEATKALYKAMSDMENKISKRNPFRAVGESFGRMRAYREVLSGLEGTDSSESVLLSGDTMKKLGLGKKAGTKKKSEIEEGAADATRNFEKSLKDAIDELGNFKNGLDFLASTFDALGFGGAANFVGDASSVLGNTLSGASALSFLGPEGAAAGAAAGAALGLIGGIAQIHDAALERKIQALREDVQNIDNTLNTIKSLRERALGYDNGERRRLMAEQYRRQMSGFSIFGMNFANNDTANAMYEYYSRGGLGGNGYTQELNALKKQREDYQKMYDAENDKKKKSTESLEEYKVKMAELDEQIMYYTEDLAKELWGIDIKGWADQIGDALMSAFENGTSAAEAYRDAVGNIMRETVSQMLKVGILEPMFERLSRKLFDYTDESGNTHKGVFDIDNPSASAQRIAATMNEWFGENGEGKKTITAANEYLTQMEKLMNEQGLSLKGKSGNTAAKSVQSTISEETGGMLYGVFNAMRQDTSVLRIIGEQFLNSYWASYMETVTASASSLRSIESHTASIVTMMNEGQGAMYEQIAAMRRKMDDFTQPDGRLRVS